TENILGPIKSWECIRRSRKGDLKVKISLTAFAVMAMLVILCVSVAAFSQAPTDRGFLAGKKYDMKGPAPRLANGHPDLGGVWDRPGVQDVTKSFTAKDGMKQTGQAELQFTEG